MVFSLLEISNYLRKIDAKIRSKLVHFFIGTNISDRIIFFLIFIIIFGFALLFTDRLGFNKTLIKAIFVCYCKSTEWI